MVKSSILSDCKSHVLDGFKYSNLSGLTSHVNMVVATEHLGCHKTRIGTFHLTLCLYAPFMNVIQIMPVMLVMRVPQARMKGFDLRKGNVWKYRAFLCPTCRLLSADCSSDQLPSMSFSTFSSVGSRHACLVPGIF